MQRELEEQRVRREEEERIRREEEERIRREEEERKAREERDRRREASISAQINEMAEMEARLKCMKRKLEGDMAALPTAQRARFAGPIAAGLRPLREWTHETALSWFDDTFAFSDLYREHFRRARIDGPGLATARDWEPGMQDIYLRDFLHMPDALHRARVAKELATHADVGPSSMPASSSSLAGACVICHDKDASMALLPRGHLCLCGECCDQLKQSSPLRCPMCRDNATGATRIFLNAAAE